jgi:two-component system response regulator NreC
MTGTPVRVLVVDDHAVVRTGLRRILDAEQDIETVGEAPNAERALYEALELKPDVVLLDVVMPGKSGIEAMPSSSRRPTRGVVLSMQDDPRYVREAFAAGASGYVLKEAADTELVQAIREVADGGRYVHPALGARMITAEADERRRAEEDPLSEREREVLRLLALGHTNQEIAKMLNISVRTARNTPGAQCKLGLSSGPNSNRYSARAASSSVERREIRRRLAPPLLLSGGQTLSTGALPGSRSARDRSQGASPLQRPQPLRAAEEANAGITSPMPVRAARLTTMPKIESCSAM